MVGERVSNRDYKFGIDKIVWINEIMKLLNSIFFPFSDTFSPPSIHLNLSSK